MDQKQIRKAWKKVVAELDSDSPPKELLDLIENALVDLNRIANATENLERKTIP